MNKIKQTVLKFGGSVLSSQRDFPRIADEIKSFTDDGYQVFAVVSAYFGVTENLISQARKNNIETNSLEYAQLIASGEFESARDLSDYLIEDSIQASWKSPSELSFIAKGNRNSASPISIDSEKIAQALQDTPVVVMPGFSAIDQDQNCVLLGRGGSDISAVCVAQALKLNEVRLLKDVDGLYDKDPNKHSNAKRLPFVDYNTARKIGGELIQTEAINFAASKQICIDIATIGNQFASRIGPKQDTTESVLAIAAAQ